MDLGFHRDVIVQATESVDQRCRYSDAFLKPSREEKHEDITNLEMLELRSRPVSGRKLVPAPAEGPPLSVPINLFSENHTCSPSFTGRKVCYHPGLDADTKLRPPHGESQVLRSKGW